jgi:hypothetical protein
MRITTAMMLAAIAACASSEAKVPIDVAVELSAVTLADECGRPPPPAVKFAQPPGKPAPSTPAVAARCAGPNCNFRGSCEQTSMQLAIHSQPGTKPTVLKVKKVELLDTKGNVLEVLTARDPSVWNDGDAKYVAWDQTIGADATLKTMYALSSPSWDKLTNGRYNAHNKTFQLRVTVTIGTGTRTIEKQAITPARLSPPVPT